MLPDIQQQILRLLSYIAIISQVAKVAICVLLCNDFNQRKKITPLPETCHEKPEIWCMIFSCK